MSEFDRTIRPLAPFLRLLRVPWRGVDLRPGPLCTSLTDIVESRSHVVALSSPSCVRLPALRSRPGQPRGARKSAHAPPRWSRCGRLSPHTGANRPHHCPVRDRWAIFPEESGRPRTLCSAAPASRENGANRTHVARPTSAGAIDTAMRGKSHTPRAARCRVCVLPRCGQVGEIGAGPSRTTGCPAGPVTDLDLTPTALRNKVNQYGGKCASRFPGQSPFGGCSGRKATGHGRRNRAM
jgi:hypothetical protein